MISKILIGTDARESLARGIDVIAKVVKRTAGASGQLTMIDHMNFPYPSSTKDGYLSGNSIFLENKDEQAGVRLVKNACESTVNATGDGSTATATLIQSLVNKGIEVLDGKDANVNLVARGMVKAKDNVINYLNKKSRKVNYGSKNLLDIATISANNDKRIGKLVSDSISRAGEYGRVNVEESNSIYTTVDDKQGFVLDGGLMASEFINNGAKATNELINPLILVTNHTIENILDISEILTLSQQQQRPILIIAQTIQGDALSTIVINFVKKRILANCVELPSYGDNSLAILSDISASVGARFVSLESGIALGEVTLEMLGTCEKAVTDRYETRLIGGDIDNDAIAEAIYEINEQLKTEEIQSSVKEFLESRLASLSTGITTIYVGAQTKIEASEMKDRIEDCLGSCKVSIKSGASIGGGVALYNASMDNKVIYNGVDNTDEMIGAIILESAIREPSINIIGNSGIPVDEAINLLNDLQKNEVFNVLTYKTENAYKSGIVDATEVITVALDNAVSTAITVLKTSSLVINES